MWSGGGGIELQHFSEEMTSQLAKTQSVSMCFTTSENLMNMQYVMVLFSIVIRI